MKNYFKIKDIPVDFLIKRALYFTDLKDTLHILNHQITLLIDKARSLADIVKLKDLDEALYHYDKYETQTEFFNSILADLKKINLEGVYEYDALVYFLEGITRPKK